MYQHGLFNLGRTTSYAALGGLFGALGSVLYVTMETLLSVTNAVRGSVGVVVLGVLIICHGIGSVVGRHGSILHKLPIPGLSIDRLMNSTLSQLARVADGPGIVGLGLVHGLVPCQCCTRRSSTSLPSVLPLSASLRSPRSVSGPSRRFSLRNGARIARSDPDGSAAPSPWRRVRCPRLRAIRTWSSNGLVSISLTRSCHIIYLLLNCRAEVTSDPRDLIVTARIHGVNTVVLRLLRV